LDHNKKTHSEDEWTLVSEPEPLPQQIDNFNCGIFIIMYIDILILEKNQEDLCNYDPNQCRIMYQKELLQKSVAMENFCLICCAETPTSKMCNVCLRKTCESCYLKKKKSDCFLCSRNTYLKKANNKF
jgi:Ulp1 protease family, C-terminal catalytic domain